MTKQDIINYVTETPQNTNPAILNTMLDQLSSGSGGGSSDFSTAEVTLIVKDHYNSFGLYDYESSDPPYGHHCFAVDSGQIITNSFRVPDGETRITYTLYYIGDSIVIFPDNMYESSTGDVVYDSDTGELTITGDCTISGWYADD